MILSWLARLASHPLVARVLVPAIAAGLTRFLDNLAGKVETRSAVKAAKAAKTSEELREASRKLSDATSRR